VTVTEVSSVIARGTSYWDMAYRNIAVFASRGSGTLQVAIKEIQQDGTFVVQGVVQRAQQMSEIQDILIHGIQRFIPFR
jgi:hypothetical protein